NLRMCSATPRRIAVIGSIVSPGCASAATGCGTGVGGGVGGGAVVGAGAGEGGGRVEVAPGGSAPAGRGIAGRAGPGAGLGVAAGSGAAPAPDSMNPRMSFFVTRPPVPVPATRPGSTP